MADIRSCKYIIQYANVSHVCNYVKETVVLPDCGLGIHGNQGSGGHCSEKEESRHLKTRSPTTNYTYNYTHQLLLFFTSTFDPFVSVLSCIIFPPLFSFQPIIPLCSPVYSTFQLIDALMATLIKLILPVPHTHSSS